MRLSPRLLPTMVAPWGYVAGRHVPPLRATPHVKVPLGTTADGRHVSPLGPPPRGGSQDQSSRRSVLPSPIMSTDLFEGKPVWIQVRLPHQRKRQGKWDVRPLEGSRPPEGS